MDLQCVAIGTYYSTFILSSTICHHTNRLDIGIHGRDHKNMPPSDGSCARRTTRPRSCAAATGIGTVQTAVLGLLSAIATSTLRELNPVHRGWLVLRSPEQPPGVQVPPLHRSPLFSVSVIYIHVCDNTIMYLYTKIVLMGKWPFNLSCFPVNQVNSLLVFSQDPTLPIPSDVVAVARHQE